MLSKIKEFFTGDASIAIDSSGTPSGHDLHLATGVLLLEMAAADSEIGEDEVAAICVTLKRQFDIPDEEIDELVAASIAKREHPERVDEFLDLINQHFADDQRRLVLAMIWQVVIADGKVDACEDLLAGLLASRLNLTAEDSAKARTMAEKGDV